MRRNIRVALGENARWLGTLRFDAQGGRESAAFAHDGGAAVALSALA
jgi:serine/threonine-protein kinase HipA